MAIKLGDNNLTNLDGLMESLGLRVASLTDASIHNENSGVWLDSLLDLKHLIKEGLLLFVSTRGINNDDLVVFLSEELYTLFGNQNRIGFILVSEEWALDFSCVHF